VPLARSPAVHGLRVTAGALALACLVALAGCASLREPSGAAAARMDPVADVAFVAQGRLSARRGNDAVTAHFRWEHAPPRDAVRLTTPLGQGVAELEGDASVHRVRVRTAEGRELEAADWEALTARTLGFPLPVGGLAAWIRGGPHAASAHSVERDDAGRAGVLRQDGWEIVFAYADDEAALPRALTLRYADVEVRLVVDRRG